jgi:hypothetical protein
MTTTFPVDNRNILNEADATTGWTATDGPTLFTADPSPVEATGCLAMQASAEVQDAYITITSDDYSQGGTLSIWMADRAAPDTTANVGIGIQLGDGTDRVAFSVGSDTVTGFRHDTGPVKWACFVLDPANLPVDTALLAGVEANLTLTAITQVGVYFSTVVKSVGGADNVFWDIVRWADPGDDVVMQGGTTAGAAGNGAEAAAVDRSTGNQQAYGVIRELAAGVYGIQGNLTIGNSASATDQYWEETNVTYAWEARNLFDRNYYRFNFVGRTGQTSSIIFTASTLSCPSGADLRIDTNGVNLDVVTFDACTFIGVGVGIIGSDDTGDNWTGCAYVDCAALEAKGCDHSDSSFSGGLVCALIEAQDETSYGDTATQGSFSPGTGYAVSDTITLSNGAIITVDTLSGSAVATFTVTTSEGFPAYPGYTLTQSATSGTGTGFELWPRSANLAEGGSIYYDLNVDPDGELDGISFTKGTADTHAIVFGPNIPASISLRSHTYSGYSASNNVASSTLHFLDTTGTITVNIVGGGDTPSYKTEGATIVINNAVTVTVEGLTKVTPVTVIADETAGTVTAGDVLSSGFTDANGEYSFSQNYEGAFEPSGLDVVIRARNQGVAASFAVDGAVVTDETAEGSSNTTGDMNILPVPGVALNDWYGFGHLEQFGQLRIWVGTAVTWTGTKPLWTWEYWNGAWTALSGVVDGTDHFANTGPNTVSWTLPGDWVATTIPGDPGGFGDLYLVRARFSTVGGITGKPLGDKVQLDATRYLPYVRSRIISGTGLIDVASWIEDSISQF